MLIDLSDKPMIKGEKVLLRPFHEEDFLAIEECLTDPEVILLTGSTRDFDREVVEEWYRTRHEQTDRLDLAIVDLKTGQFVGEVVLNFYDEIKHSMNFRILIGPNGRDRGLGSEATRLIVDHAFTETDLKQLTLSVFAFNPRAKRVYEKAGFVLESMDEKELEHEGQWIDSLNMVLTRERWQEVA